MTNTIRYGARPPADQTDHEIDAVTAPIVTEAVNVVYETDPSIVAAVLPRPLAPADEPLVRVSIQRVAMNGREFGSAVFAVAARHGEVVGDYPLFMPQSTEQSVIGGRETVGEPKKLGEITLQRDGDRVEASVARLGHRLVDVTGTVVESRDIPAEPVENIEFYFKFLRSPQGDGITDPHLVECTYRRHYETIDGIDGEIALGDSPLDPIADIAIGRVRSIEWCRRRTAQRARVAGPVPAEWLLPFVHQRYDDIALLSAPARN